MTRYQMWVILLKPQIEPGQKIIASNIYMNRPMFLECENDYCIAKFKIHCIAQRHIASKREILDFPKVYWISQIDLHVYCRVWHSYGFWYERISEYIRIKKMTRMNIRIYSHEFFWHERISEYIRIKKIYTNECPNKYSYRKYLNIRIYSSHSGLDWHQICAFTI